MLQHGEVVQRHSQSARASDATKQDATVSNKYI